MAKAQAPAAPPSPASPAPAATPAPLVSPDWYGFSPLYDRDWLLGLPWSSDVTSFLETTEAVAVSDRLNGPGFSAGEPARLGIHAASWTELQYRLDGFEIGDPERLGRPLVLLPRFGLEALRLGTAALAPEQDGPGAVLALETRRPTPGWTGFARGTLAPHAFQQDPRATTPPPIVRLHDAHELAAFASGPLAGERLGASLALEREQAARIERAEPASIQGERWSGIGQLLWTPRPSDEARLLIAGHDLTRPAAGRRRFDDPKVQDGERALFAGGVYRRGSPGGVRASLLASFAARSSDPAVAQGSPFAVDRLDGPPAETVNQPSTLHVWRAEGTFESKPLAQGGLRHELGATVQAEWSGLRVGEAPAVTIAESVDGRAARVLEFSAAAQAQRSLRRVALSASDRLSIGDRLAARVGLRLEDQDGGRPDAPGSIVWRDVSPRASLQAKPLAGLPVVVHGGFARYAGRLPLQLLAFGDAAARSTSVFRWNDRNGDLSYRTAERGVLVSRSGPGGSFVEVDPELARPRTTEWTAGLALEIGRKTRLALTGIHRRTSGLVETTNVGVTAASYRVRLLADPGVDLAGASDDRLLPVYDRDPASFGQDRYLLTNPAGHDVTHEGVELLGETALSRVRVRLSGSASQTLGAGANRSFHVGENDPGVPGELFDDPNADTFASGRLFFDRAYTLKLAAEYHSPGGFRAGAVTRYQDGQPFARLVVVEGLAQGPELVQAVSRGDHRFTYTLTVDALLSKTFSLGRAQATLGVEAFSLFRQRSEIEEYVVSGPRFRDVTAIQPPRSLRVSLALGY